MFNRLLLTILMLGFMQSCSTSEVAEPVFLVSETATDSKDNTEPPIHLQAKSVKKSSKKKSPAFEAEEVESKSEVESAAQDIFLATITTDYTERTYDLMLSLDEKSNVSAIKTKSNRGKIKNYPLAVLNREVVLVKAVGVSLVTLLCQNFSQEMGCPIEIEYPSNITYGKFLRFQAQLKNVDGAWQLQSRDRAFSRMHLVAKKVFGLLIGVDRIELR